MASNVGQFSAWRRFVRAPLQSHDRDYREITIEHRVSNAHQNDGRLSHEFQTCRGTDINAVNAALAALQSDQAPPGRLRNSFGPADDVHLGEDSFPVRLDGAFTDEKGGSDLFVTSSFGH
jgi:hypothetical protein